jgi:hypothetical protein
MIRIDSVAGPVSEPGKACEFDVGLMLSSGAAGV